MIIQTHKDMVLACNELKEKHKKFKQCFDGIIKLDALIVLTISFSLEKKYWLFDAINKRFKHISNIEQSLSNIVRRDEDDDHNKDRKSELMLLREIMRIVEDLLGK